MNQIKKLANEIFIEGNLINVEKEYKNNVNFSNNISYIVYLVDNFNCDSRRKTNWGKRNKYRLCNT